MPKGLFVIGTDTGVGKTVFSAGLMYLLLKQNYKAGYYKPIASGEVDMKKASVPTDAWFVKLASGYAEEDESITPYSFKPSVSPHLAARLTGREIDPSRIKEGLELLKTKYEWLLVEGCGGMAVPLKDNGYMLYDLILNLGLSCILVARSSLGTINHTLLTLRFAERLGIAIKGIFLSGYAGSEVEADNLQTLKNLTHHPCIVTVPALEGTDVEALKTGNLREAFERSIDITQVVKLMDPI